MSDQRRADLWEYVDAAVREIRTAGMSIHAAARLNEAMQRIVNRTTKRSDAKHLAGEIYEVRVRADDRQYRLLFAFTRGGHAVALALRLFVKKTEKTPRNEIKLAERRRARWLSTGKIG